MAETLKEQTAKGLLWGGISNGVQQLLNLFFGIFLARLLTPADYGMVGMLTIFSLIAGTIQESGFTAALANKKNIKHEDYNAVFWFSSLTGLFLYTLLFCGAPLIARFFHTPELITLARYSFLGFLISSTGVAHSAWLFRSLRVKQRAMASVFGLLLSGTVGITLAWAGFAYWGIATQSLVYVATTTGCYWYFSAWRPSLHIDFSPLKEMITFSSKLLVTNLFIHLNNNLFSILLGRYYSEREVGFYNQANKWNYMGYSVVNGMVSGVAQPVLAQVSDDRKRQLRVFRRMMRFTCFIAFPAMLGLSLIAPELITITITDKWAESARILQILCVSGAFIPVINLCSYLLISKGKSDIYMWNTIILAVIQLGVATVLYPYGIRWMIICYAAINILWLPVWHHFVRREIGYRFLHLLKDVLPYLFIAAGVMAISYWCTAECTHIYVRFACKIFLAASLYLLVMWIGGSVTFKESIQYLRKGKKATNRLTLIPVGGLANRMKAIDAAVALSQEAHITLRILWFKDRGLNCRFDQLFEPLNLNGITVKEASFIDKLLYDRPRRRNFYIPRLFQRVFFDACIYEKKATRLFYRHFDFLAWAKDKNCYLASCVYFRPQKERPYFNTFQPTEHIRQQIDTLCRNFNESTIGIHIRRTDNIASIRQSPTDLFIAKMREAIAEDNRCRFYLATDSEEEKNRIKKLFGNRILTYPRAANRNSVQGIQDALTELYILSRTKKIFGSMQSSYSETAAQISGIHCELLTIEA